MDRARLSVDVAVIGAGISGLWLANLLARRGLSLVICEPNPIGGTQTLASQGIIHSGVKYALDGRATPLAQALADMPARWRACLGGVGEIDLRGVPVLAERVSMRVAGATANDGGLLAGNRRAVQSQRHDDDRTPSFDRGAPDDFVVDVPSLVRRLAEPLVDRLIAQPVTPAALVRNDQGVDRIELNGCTISAGVYVFAAGSGNEALARRAGIANAPMQRRPLCQTKVRLRSPVRLFAHCVSMPSDLQPATPTMTVTSHGDVLCVGGKVADDGAARSNRDQVQLVRDLLAREFPSVDLTGAAFDTFTAVRAEPTLQGTAVAADAVAVRSGNCLVCWPVKLSLAPRLGDIVLAELRDLEPMRDPWQGNRNPRIDYAPSPYSTPTVRAAPC